MLLCLAVNCGYPGAPGNGQAQYSTTTYNSVVTYTCEDGYTLQGSYNRTCQSDMEWTGSVPQCNRETKLWSTVTGGSLHAPLTLYCVVTHGWIKVALTPYAV